MKNSKKKISQFKYILVAEPHPEIHYISKKILAEDQNVLILIDFYFKEWEAKILLLSFYISVKSGSYLMV